VNTVVSRSLEETAELGRKIARTLHPGSVVAFSGGLGSGKTYLIKAVCRELGITEVVTSPTFTLMHIYEGSHPVLHLDCYRLRSPAEAEMLGIDEYFNAEYICLIEWADKIREIIPAYAVRVSLSRVPEQRTWRTITIDGL